MASSSLYLCRLEAAGLLYPKPDAYIITVYPTLDYAMRASGHSTLLVPGLNSAEEGVSQEPHQLYGEAPPTK